MKRFAVLLIIALLLFSSTVHGQGDYIDSFTEKALVIEAGEEESSGDTYGDVFVQEVKLEILSGKYKGQIIDSVNYLSDNVAYNIHVSEGDKVVVMIDEYDDGSIEVHVSDYSRSDYILYLTILFLALILVIGKMKGLKAIISLGLTLGSVVFVLLPQILKGVNPIPLSILISIVITVVTMFLVSGINSKSISAILGTSAGVLIAGLISYYVGSKIHMTGLGGEEATMLMYIPQDIEINLKNILFSGIILGSLGAVMDVGMSIASSIEEIHNANNELSMKDLFQSGMNVGKDVMGTMTNTLILAYTGSSIPLLLLFMAYETSLVKIANLDIIATEIVRSLSGSIGLVLTIPITALLASFLIKRERKKTV